MKKKDLWHDPAFLHKLIPSATLREHMAATGWEPTDFQLAALISHMAVSLEEKETYWTAIAQRTGDQTLREHIKEMIRRQRVFALLQSPGKCVFGLGAKDDTGENEPFEVECGYFRTFNEAFAMGCQTRKPFKIRKILLGPAQRRAVGGFNPFLEGAPPGQERLSFTHTAQMGVMEYNGEGKVMFWDMALDADPEVTPGEALQRSFDPTFFANAYVPLPNPFQRGEMVAILNQASGEVKDYGLVRDTQEDWEAYHQQERYRDYWDEALVVECINETNGDFTHSHISPLYLERGTPEDEITRKYLLEGQQLLLGKGSLQGLFRARDAYRRAHCGKEKGEAI